jgi:predicted dehydrogenase
MKQALQDGLIGTPMMFRNRFAGVLPAVESRWFSDPALAGGGVIMDTCVHSVDLFRYLFGDVRRVQASATTRASDLGPALRVEDTAILTLTSLDGVIGVIEASWRTAPGEWTVSVYGTSGTLTMDYSTMNLVHQNADGTRTTMPISDEDRFMAEVRHFAACVRGEAELLVTGIDGRQATAILVAAMADAKST